MKAKSVEQTTKSRLTTTLYTTLLLILVFMGAGPTASEMESEDVTESDQTNLNISHIEQYHPALEGLADKIGNYELIQTQIMDNDDYNDIVARIEREFAECCIEDGGANVRIIHLWEETNIGDILHVGEPAKKANTDWWWGEALCSYPLDLEVIIPAPLDLALGEFQRGLEVSEIRILSPDGEAGICLPTVWDKIGPQTIADGNKGEKGLVRAQGEGRLVQWLNTNFWQAAQLEYESDTLCSEWIEGTLDDWKEWPVTNVVLGYQWNSGGTCLGDGPMRWGAVGAHTCIFGICADATAGIWSEVRVNSEGYTSCHIRLFLQEWPSWVPDEVKKFDPGADLVGPNQWNPWCIADGKDLEGFIGRFIDAGGPVIPEDLFAVDSRFEEYLKEPLSPDNCLGCHGHLPDLPDDLNIILRDRVENPPTFGSLENGTLPKLVVYDGGE